MTNIFRYKRWLIISLCLTAIITGWQLKKSKANTDLIIGNEGSSNYKHTVSTTEKTTENTLQKQHTTCDDGCINRMIDEIQNTELSAITKAKMMATPRFYAEALAHKPEVLAQLINAQQQDEHGNSLYEVAFIIQQQYNNHETLDLARQFSQGTNLEERQTALTLFSQIANSSDTNLQSFADFVQTEYEPTLLSSAIQLAAQVQGEANKAAMLNALSNVIQSNVSDHIVGTALMSKAKLQHNAPYLDEEIFDALSSYSATQNRLGLRAVESVMAQYLADGTDDEIWQQQNPMIHQGLDQLAMNDQINDEIQQKAIGLLEAFF